MNCSGTKNVAFFLWRGGEGRNEKMAPHWCKKKFAERGIKALKSKDCLRRRGDPHGECKLKKTLIFYFA